MKEKFKRLLSLLTFPEANALWAVLTTPLKDILTFQQRIQTLEHELGIAQEEVDYTHKVLRNLMNHRAEGIKWRFDCQACGRDTEQVAPPQLVWTHRSESLQCCAGCAPGYWDGRANKNHRAQIRPVTPAPKGWRLALA